MKKKLIVFASVYLVVIQGAILFYISLLEKTPEEKVVMFLTGSIVLWIAVIVMKIMKRSIHKHRPPKRIEYFTPEDKFAFPSGHATGLSAISFFILEKNFFWGLIAIFFSVIIMIARVKAHVHDALDIIGGIVLGAGIAYLSAPYVEKFVIKLADVIFSYF